jgi:hypothetical protein
VLVTPCERAVWVSHWPYAELALDGLDAWRCTIFRNEGAGLSSDLIRVAMDITASVWGELPPDGWLTWIDTRKVNSRHPGYCFKQAGWWLDREYRHPHLLRLRALVDGWDNGHRRATPSDGREPLHRVNAPEIPLRDIEPSMAQLSLEGIERNALPARLDSESRRTSSFVGSGLGRWHDRCGRISLDTPGRRLLPGEPFEFGEERQ